MRDWAKAGQNYQLGLFSTAGGDHKFFLISYFIHMTTISIHERSWEFFSVLCPSCSAWMLQTTTPTCLLLTQLWSTTMKETVPWQAAWAPLPPRAQTRTRTMTTSMTGAHASRNWLKCTAHASYPIAIQSFLLRAHIHQLLPKTLQEKLVQHSPIYTFGVGTTDEDGMCVYGSSIGNLRKLFNSASGAFFWKVSAGIWETAQVFFSSSAVMDQWAISWHRHDSTPSTETKADRISAY